MGPKAKPMMTPGRPDGGEPSRVISIGESPPTVSPARPSARQKASSNTARAFMTDPAGRRSRSWALSVGRGGSYSSAAARLGGMATTTRLARTETPSASTRTPVASWEMDRAGVRRHSAGPSSSATRFAVDCHHLLARVVRGEGLESELADELVHGVLLGAEERAAEVEAEPVVGLAPHTTAHPVARFEHEHGLSCAPEPACRGQTRVTGPHDAGIDLVCRVFHRAPCPDLTRLAAQRSDQAFLYDRHDEAAVLGEDLASREAAGAVGARAVLVVEEPVVGPERAVEPHGMVEAGHHRGAVVPAADGVGQEGGVEQGEVRLVGNDARVQQGLVGQLAVGLDPHLLAGRQGLVRRPLEWRLGDVAGVDGAGALVPVPEEVLVRLNAL